MKIALVAFRGTIAATVAAQCEGFYTYTVGSGAKHVKTFCQLPDLVTYDFIVAMGVTTRRPRGFVRVEQACAGGRLDTSLVDGQLFQVSTTIGSSWCNVLATELVAITKARPAFLHIPSGINTVTVAKLLQAKLSKY